MSTPVAPEPNPAESRALYGKSINLKYDNYLFHNDEILYGDFGFGPIPVTAAAQGPWAAPKTYTLKMVRNGRKVTVTMTGSSSAAPATTANIIGVTLGNIPLFYRPPVPIVPYSYTGLTYAYDASAVTICNWAFTVESTGDLDFVISAGDTVGTSFSASGLVGLDDQHVIEFSYYV